MKSTRPSRLETVIKEIKEAQAPLDLYVGNNNIGDTGAWFLAETIKEARVPLTLSLGNNNIGEAGAEFLAGAIKEVRVPLTLRLDGNNIGETGARFLAQSLKVAQVPLILGLSCTGIGEAGAQFLAQSLKEAQVPITLSLGSNNIGEAGAGFLAEAIKEARVPIILKLDRNNIGAVGAKFLAQSLKEARAPVTLRLDRNNMGDAGAEFLAQSLKEARIPITLDLSWTGIGEAGARFLSQSLKEAQAPITLKLDRNSIGEAGAEFLAQSLKEARVPLTLYLSDARIIAAAKRDNFIIDARESPEEFFANLRFNPFNLLGLRPILIQTPVVKELVQLNYPKDIAMIIQEYDPDIDYLAWKVVSAIREVEGASHENKYASIDYELLTAVYSTAPVADSAPDLVLCIEQMEDDGHEEVKDVPQRTAASHPSRLRKRKQGSNIIAEQVAGSPHYKLQPHKKKRDSSHEKVEEQAAEEQYYNASSIEDDSPGSSSSSSSSSNSYGAPPPGGGANDAADLTDQDSTNYLSSGVQSLNHELVQASQSGSDNRDLSATDRLLKTLFTWIKDIPEELQQRILFSFSIQQMLKFLEATLDPSKFIEDQLSSSTVQEKFEAEHQLCVNTTCASQEYAQSNLDVHILLDEHISDELNNGILVLKSNSHSDAFSLFGDIGQSASM